jgi:hypothetical protein
VLVIVDERHVWRVFHIFVQSIPRSPTLASDMPQETNAPGCGEAADPNVTIGNSVVRASYLGLADAGLCRVRDSDDRRMREKFQSRQAS